MDERLAADTRHDPQLARTFLFHVECSCSANLIAGFSNNRPADFELLKVAFVVEKILCSVVSLYGCSFKPIAVKMLPSKNEILHVVAVSFAKIG